MLYYFLINVYQFLCLNCMVFLKICQQSLIYSHILVFNFFCKIFVSDFVGCLRFCQYAYITLMIVLQKQKAACTFQLLKLYIQLYHEIKVFRASSPYSKKAKNTIESKKAIIKNYESRIEIIEISCMQGKLLFMMNCIHCDAIHHEQQLSHQPPLLHPL